MVMNSDSMKNPLQMEGFMGKPSINGLFSMAMSNNQMVIAVDGDIYNIVVNGASQWLIVMNGGY